MTPPDAVLGVLGGVLFLSGNKGMSTFFLALRPFAWSGERKRRAAARISMRRTIGPVFTSRFGRAYKPSGLCSILRRRGGITPYQLRHTFAQTASDSGEVPVQVLARLMGHADTKTTGFYFKVRDQRAIRAAKTLRLHCAKTAATG